MVRDVEFRTDPHPAFPVLNELWLSAWGEPLPADMPAILSRSLAHIGAYAEDVMIGFVNVAWDGGKHAFILDTCVHRHYQRQGVATGLVQSAIAIAKMRGASWLHVDYEPHLTGFYCGCGFRPTAAGLIDLTKGHGG
ncbi:TPA: GNAT family N-acetyltransferase [Serratia marcescens]